MTQVYEKVMEVPEVEKIKVEISEESKMDELLGDLNPRYFEEVMAPENALDKAHAARISNNLIRPF
ncbi:MAG: hypothetical protein KGD58_02915 [Candidatus Lokiarchaeota archaeon]|nr:hypothetical protein [Candidatus Lokiarchaeota archaeon]